MAGFDSDPAARLRRTAWHPFRAKPRTGTSARLGRPVLLLVGMWVLGTIAVIAVIQFERRVDQARHAQVVISEVGDRKDDLVATAFDPATSAAATVPDRGQHAARLLASKQALAAAIAKLAAAASSDAPARITILSVRYLALIDEIATLVSTDRSRQAALAWGESKQPGGITAALSDELVRADVSYGEAADRSRTVASIGSVVAILFLLCSFSVALGSAMRGRRRSHRDATTDALTGLGNRRKLFADMGQAAVSLHDDETLTVGILDLDGFKAYNDTFGHPAGDSLLARLGARLAAVVDGSGRAYRIGGDEFVVITSSGDGERKLAAARSALSERGAGFSVGCSLGSTLMVAGASLEEALHVADQRLYAHKLSARSELRSEVKDALLQVLTEQDPSLVAHLGHVAALAESTAIALGLSSDQIELTQLAAELHDIGKSAIPASILDKPGPLDAAERSFMERHSTIGERIVAAAPTLEAIAPIVRSAHERADGGGYPDGLMLDEIPICSRIIAVVDAFDAMTHDRPYRRAMPEAAALAELRRHGGTQFDPLVAEAFTSVLAARDALARAA